MGCPKISTERDTRRCYRLAPESVEGSQAWQKRMRPMGNTFMCEAGVAGASLGAHVN